MLGRRLLTIPAVLVALPLLVLTSPVWLVGGALVDLMTGLRRLPTVRLGLFAVVYLAHEWAGVAAAGALWIRERFRAMVLRQQLHPVATTHPYRRIQGWWASSLLRWAGRLVGLRLELPDPTTLPTDSFILLSRHASMVDAILPADVVTKRLGRFAHYVIKAELRWVPNLDLFGHRLGNYFVARDADGDREAAAISRFARTALPDSALVIFPEGTYATPSTRARVIASLERRGDTPLAAYARSLQHLLPPKPAGTLALLAEQPHLDVVVLGHVGLEGVAHLTGLRRRLPLERPVVVDWWRFPRSDIPVDESSRIAWLNDRWRTLDAWVASVDTGSMTTRTDGTRRETGTQQ